MNTANPHSRLPGRGGSGPQRYIPEKLLFGYFSNPGKIKYSVLSLFPEYFCSPSIFVRRYGTQCLYMKVQFEALV